MAGNRDFEIILKMRAEFAQAQAELKKAQKEIGQVGDELAKTNKIGSTARSVFVGVGVAAAAMSVVAIAGLKKYIENTAEAEKVQAQLASRIQDTMGAAGRSLAELNVQSKKLEGLTVFDDEAIGGAQAMLLTFNKIKGVEFDKATAAVLDLATVTGQALPDAARQLGKALNDPIGGLAGLSKAGIQFSDDEKKVIKALVDAGDTAGAQERILKSLEGRMGTAAEAARNTLSGALAALENSFNDLLEGDTGQEGIKGTRDAIESLIVLLNDPDTKHGFDTLVNGALTAVAAFVRLLSTTANVTKFLGEEVAARIHGPAVDDLVRIGDRIERLKTTIDAVKNSGGLLGGFSLLNASELVPSDLLKSAPEVLARLQRELDKEQNKLKIGVDLSDEAARIASEAGKAVVAAPVTGTGTGASTGTGTGKGAKTADPDAAGLRRLESLREEAALLDAVKDGETQASAAAKLRYDLTQGELKGISPQLKQQLLDEQAVIDQKHADVDAETARKKAFDDTKQAYDSLREGLRTPAEVALDAAIARVQTLNDALAAGIPIAGGYDAAVARIAGGVVDKQPDFQGLAPEVGGAFGELGKLDEAAAKEQQWYTDALARLQAFRDAQGGVSAAADAQQEAAEAQHQARLRQIEGARQQASLSIASDFFGQLATLQHSHNSKMAAIGKAAAIAQTIINTYQSATQAYAAWASPPAVGPARGVGAAPAASAAGLANVAQIRAQSTAFADGGHVRGPGTGTSDSIPARLSDYEFVTRSAIVRQPGALPFLEDFNDRGMAALYSWAGYADGGLVTPSAPQLSAPDFASFPQGGGSSAAVNNRMRLYLYHDIDEFAAAVANHPTTEKKILATIGENGNAIRADWNS